MQYKLKCQKIDKCQKTDGNRFHIRKCMEFKVIRGVWGLISYQSERNVSRKTDIFNLTKCTIESFKDRQVSYKKNKY